MEAKIISKHTLPDTYGEWLEDFKKTVVEPFHNEAYYRTAEKMEKRSMRLDAIHKEFDLMREHYGIDQLKRDYCNIISNKINHVEITCNIQL